jgi:hypothetical protein
MQGVVQARVGKTGLHGMCCGLLKAVFLENGIVYLGECIGTGICFEITICPQVTHSNVWSWYQTGADQCSCMSGLVGELGHSVLAMAVCKCHTMHLVIVTQ